MSHLRREDSTLKDQLELLANLQEIDKEIDRHTQNMSVLPLEIQNIARNLVVNRRAIGETKERIEKIEKDLRQKEQDLAVEQEKIKRSEKRLLSIKNQKEYNALTREVKLGKKVVAELEESVLALMTELESLKKSLDRKEKEYAEQETSLTEKKQLAEKATAEAEKALSSLQTEKDRTVQHIERTFLSRYENIKKLRGYALAEMNNGNCSGCHMAVPPQMNIRVLKQEEIIECPNCHRILYVKQENIPEYNKLEN
jgi:uncharacterized protein